MPESLIEQWAQFLRPNGRIKHERGAVVQTDAPGTNSRTDIITPDTPHAKTRTGYGEPNELGYHQHGVVAAPAKRSIITRENQRYPDLAHHGRPGPEVPDYNVFYDHWGSREGWDKIILNTVHGSTTIGTSGITSAPCTLDYEARLKLSQFPGALMAFPVLILWSFALLAAGTSGEVSVSLVPNGADFQFPLGEFNVTQLEFNEHTRWIIPAPVTDRDVTSLGTLLFTSNSVVGPPTINWRMGIGWAYLLQAPAFKGYVPLHAGQAYGDDK